MRPNAQLVTSADKILNGKLHFLYSELNTEKQKRSFQSELPNASHLGSIIIHPLLSVSDNEDEDYKRRQKVLTLTSNWQLHVQS